MAKNLRIISGKKVDLDNSSVLKKVFGKSVISSTGEIFGKVKDVFVENGKIIGVIVKNKSRDIFIDISYINDLFANSLMLKINPIFRVLGMSVYDVVGKKIGKVVDVEQSNNTLNEISKLIVKKNLFSKSIYVNYSNVDSDVKNILLKKEL